MSDFVLFEADMDAALRSHYLRTGAEQVFMEMPFDRMLRVEDDGAEELADDVFRARAEGARALFEWVMQEGCHPQKLMKHLFALGRGLGIEPFCSFTMEESAMLCGEVKASHSHRCKLLSRLIERAGMKGVRLPGQKSPEASASFAAAQRGNRNRRDSVKHRHQTHDEH